MSLTLTSSRGTTRSPSRGVRLGAALLAAVVAFGAARAVTSRGDDTTASTVLSADPAVELAKLEQRIQTDPDDADAWQRLAPIYLSAASGSGDRALVLRARHAVEEAIRLRPDDIATYHADGALELTLHQFAAARQVGLAAHASHPDSPDALAILVDSSIELGRYDEAEDYLRLLLGLRPNASALARVSYLREIRGDLPGARIAMSQAATAASGNASESATITTLVGDLALASGERERALDAYRQANATEPERSLTELGMARALAALGRTDEAIDILTTSIERFPEPALWTLLGELSESTGRDEEASAIYTQTAALIDRHGASGEDNSLEAARLHADHADPDDAVRFATVAFDNRPTVFAADVLAWSLTRAGRADEALPHVELANRLGTDSVDLHIHSAAAYAAAGEIAEARAALSAAFAGTPYSFPELRPIATELAASLDVAVPTNWTAGS